MCLSLKLFCRLLTELHCLDSDEHHRATLRRFCSCLRRCLQKSRLRRLETHCHPTLDPAVLWTPSNDTSRPIFSDSLNLTQRLCIFGLYGAIQMLLLLLTDTMLLCQQQCELCKVASHPSDRHVDQHPKVAEEFEMGRFVIHKSCRGFSGMAIDQAHEQANAVIKADGGSSWYHRKSLSIAKMDGCRT